jgi:pimeloyl-ACP methyl ester carboxylesterase
MIMKASDPRDDARTIFRGVEPDSERLSAGTFRLGLKSLLGLGLLPLGKSAARFQRQLSSINRLDQGLILILPGIEGCSSINDSIARGLVAAHLPHAIQVIDWRKFSPWNPLQLAMERYNHQQALQIVNVITEYRERYPGRPVHLIGHSAGAGMVLFVLKQASSPNFVDSAVLLAAAVSRDFKVGDLLDRTAYGIWNFHSALDLLTVGLGTMLVGTMDRQHTVSAGALGFRPTKTSSQQTDGVRQHSGDLHQIAFQLGMVKSWNFGGHFGATNAVFVKRFVAPICRLRATDPSDSPCQLTANGDHCEK